MTGPPGFSGTLLSRDFALHHLHRRFAGELGEATVAPAHRRVASLISLARRRFGPASPVRAVADGLGAPLADQLGYRVRASTAAGDLWLLALEGCGEAIGMVVLPWGASLEQARRPAVRDALARGARWALALAGPRVRVLDTARPAASRHVTIDLEIACDDPGAFATAWALLRAEALAPGARGAGLLERVVAASAAHGERLCGAVRAGVIEAIEQILGGLVDATPRRRPLDLPLLYESALTAVYRMLFLFFAEARALVPVWHRVYRDAYSMDALRDAAERGRTRGLWEGFQAISRLAHGGCDAGDLRVPPFNGRLFAPSRAPVLDGRPVNGSRMRRALLALSTAPGPDGARVRVAWHDLGVEELGSIYEALLDYEPRVARTPVEGRQPPTAQAAVSLRRTDGARRKTSGSFYTPRAITRYLVATTLGPLVEGRSSEQLLQLRIVDPAMGSGAFLVEACRFLARRVEAALAAEQQCDPSALDGKARAGIRRLVAQRCLYGVDLNPMAVHLARLSLWLTSLAADLPLTFLDHRLAAGDSLTGASPFDLARTVPGTAQRRPDTRQLDLFKPDDLASTIRLALPIRQSLASDPDDTAAGVRQKEHALTQLSQDSGLSRWRRACDLWCGAWLSPHPLPRPVFDTLMEYVLTGRTALPAAEAAARVAEAGRAAADARVLHWALEFPEVFFTADGRPAPDAGFDAVLGNPPWEMLRADRGADADRGARARATRFTRRAGIYRAQSDGHANQFQLFVERAMALVRPAGRIGLVVPGGLATDHGSGPLRRRLLETCAVDAIVGFENRRAIFPAHRSLTFLLLTATSGQPTSAIRCRFGQQDPAVLDGLDEENAGPAPVTVTPAVLARLSGPSLAIPDLRTVRDLEIAERCAALHPALGSSAGWHARFGRELNATEDRQSFSTAAHGLPVLEGKHLAPFTVDIAAARWRIRASDARRLLGRGGAGTRPRLAYRDVASATNRLTLIAAIVPAGCVTTHTLYCLRGRRGLRDQLVLCALLNSFVANYLVRQRVRTHVTVAVVERLPVPRPVPGGWLHSKLARAAGRLVRAGGADESAASECQALSAVAWRLSPAEYEHVLSTFPLVPLEERQRARDAFIQAARP